VRLPDSQSQRRRSSFLAECLGKAAESVISASMSSTGGAKSVQNEPAQFLDQRAAPFILDGPKLTRIVTIIEERFQRVGCKAALQFTARLKSGRSIRLVSLDDLLDLDNSLHNPIKSLEIEAYCDAPQSVGVTIGFESSGNRNVVVHVASHDSKLASELFAELDEQAQRTITSSWMYRLFSGAALQITVISVALAGGIMGLLSLLSSPDKPISTGISAVDAEEVRQLMVNARTLDDKVNALVEFDRRQLQAIRLQQTKEIHLSKYFTLTNLFLILPFAIVFVCVGYMAIVCYPRFVFQWGDWEEQYKRLVDRRRTLWTVVILSLAIGIIITLFASSLVTLFPSHTAA
jgi:hypothetical protein